MGNLSSTPHTITRVRVMSACPYDGRTTDTRCTVYLAAANSLARAGVPVARDVFQRSLRRAMARPVLDTLNGRPC